MTVPGATLLSLAAQAHTPAQRLVKLRPMTWPLAIAVSGILWLAGLVVGAVHYNLAGAMP